MFVLNRVISVLIVSTVLLHSIKTNANPTPSCLDKLASITNDSLDFDSKQICDNIERALRQDSSDNQKATHSARKQGLKLDSFSSDDFVTLSRIQQLTKYRDLSSRCERFNDELKSIFRSDNKPELFNRSIRLLRQSKLPFNNHYSALGALEECVAKISEYLMPDSAEPNATGPLADKLAELEGEYALLQRQCADQTVVIESLEKNLFEESLKALPNCGHERLLQDKDAQIEKLKEELENSRQAVILLEKARETEQSRFKEMEIKLEQLKAKEAKAKKKIDDTKQMLTGIIDKVVEKYPSLASS